MGYKNQDDYERAALDFWKNGEGKLYYSFGRRNFVKYDEKTKRSCYVSHDGFVESFFVFETKSGASRYMYQDSWKEI
jgi:hypothetical protein